MLHCDHLSGKIAIIYIFLIIIISGAIITLFLISKDIKSNLCTPYSPNPTNNSTSIPITVNLSWKCDSKGNKTKYDLYFGRSTLELHLAAKNISGTYYQLDNLEYDTEYFWRIVARYKNRTIEGPIWRFRTVKKPIDFSNEPHSMSKKCLGGSGNDKAFSISRTYDNGFIIAAETSSRDMDLGEWNRKDKVVTIYSRPISLYDGKELPFSVPVTLRYSQTDGWIIKLDENGAIQWTKLIGGSENDGIYDIKPEKDGYIAVGYSSSNDGNIMENHGRKDLLLVKLDTNGNMLWQKNIGGSGDEEGYIVQVVSDGYIVGGYTVSKTTECHELPQERRGYINPAYRKYLKSFWILKFDKKGNLKWDRCFWKFSDGGEVRTIVESWNDGYIIGGTFKYPMRGVILKLNKNGFKQWHIYTGESVNKIVRTSDRSYIAVGASKGRMLIVKFNDDGEIIWERTYQRYLGQHSDEIIDIVNLPDGGFIMAGVKNKYKKVTTHAPCENKASLSDIWFIKMDSRGQFQWEKNMNDMGKNMICRISIGSDGILAIGYSNSPNLFRKSRKPEKSDFDVLLLKLEY